MNLPPKVIKENIKKSESLQISIDEYMGQKLRDFREQG